MSKPNLRLPSTSLGLTTPDCFTTDTDSTSAAFNFRRSSHPFSNFFITAVRPEPGPGPAEVFRFLLVTDEELVADEELLTVADEELLTVADEELLTVADEEPPTVADEELVEADETLSSKQAVVGLRGSLAA